MLIAVFSILFGIAAFLNPSPDKSAPEQLALGSSYLITWSEIGSDSLSVNLNIPGAPSQTQPIALDLPANTTVFKWEISKSLPALPGYTFKVSDTKGTNTITSPAFTLIAQANSNGSSSQQDPSQNSVSLSNAAIAAIVISCVLFILIVILVIRQLKKKSKYQKFNNYKIPSHLKTKNKSSFEDLRMNSSFFDEEWKSRSSYAATEKRKKTTSIFDDPRLTRSMTFDLNTNMESTVSPLYTSKPI